MTNEKYTHDGHKPFVDTMPQISLSQHDIAMAVEFWLNEKVFKHPCSILSLRPDDYQLASFTVIIQSEEAKELETKKE